jgi:hypothetical protein
MASRLEVYQGALRLLGPHQLASLSEVRPERLKLDEIWTGAVQYMLEQGMWNFAIRTVELANDENEDPLFGYDYVFSRPDDYVRTVAISDDPTFRATFERYEDEQDRWYANCQPLYVRYVSNDEAYGFNVGAWRQAFSKAIEAYLAFESGLPISGDRGNRNDMLGLFKERLAKAKTLDAVDERVQLTKPGRLTASRLAGRTGRMCR